MHAVESSSLHIIALFVYSTLFIPLFPSVITNADSNVLAQFSNGTNLGSPSMATGPEELLESIVSPGNLMDSVLEEGRNTNTSDTKITHCQLEYRGRAFQAWIHVSLQL